MFGSTTGNRLDAFRGERLLVPMLTLGFVAAAALTGLVVATGQPILIALVVGAILGVLLLGAVNVAVWLVLAGTLLVSGPTFMFMPQLVKAGWLFSLLGFFLLGVALLHPALARDRPKGRMPGFVIAFWLFLVLGLVSIVFSDGPLDEGVTAAKRYFQFYGLMFLLAVVPFQTEQIRRWFRFFLLVAILHLPFALYQRLVIVPAWEYMNGVKGFVALDIVVGAFEGEIGAGGSSSVMAFSALIAMAYVINSLREKLVGTGKGLLALLVVMAPLTLGETKVVVIWLPIVLMAVYSDQIRKHPVGFLFGCAVTAVLLVGFGWLYLALQATDGRTMTAGQRFTEAIAYNFGRTGYFGGRGLNRSTVLVYWWQHHGLHDPLGMMFGHGLGSSYGAGERVALTGHMHNVHRGQGIGQTGIAAILWDLGLIGGVLYLAAYAGAGLTALRLAREARPGFDRVLRRTLLAAIAVLITVPFYTDQVVQVPSLETLAALFLGTIAWCSRNPPAVAPVPAAAAEPFLQPRAGRMAGTMADTDRQPAPVAPPLSPAPALVGARRQRLRVEPVLSDEIRDT